MKHLGASSYYLLLGLGMLVSLPQAAAEQWITGKQIEDQATEALNVYATAYCAEKKVSPCNQRLRLNVPETRRFRVSALGQDEPFHVHVQIENTHQPFEQGYGVARVTLMGVKTQYSQILQLPVTQVEKVAVWRVIHPIALNDAVAAHVILEPQWLDAREKRNAFTDGVLPPEARARQALQAGDVLTTQALSIPPLVKAWQPIRILVHLVRSGKPMQLAMEGEALQNGSLGQRVAVRQTGFEKKRFMGTVVAPGVVRVEL